MAKKMDLDVPDLIMGEMQNEKAPALKVATKATQEARYRLDGDIGDVSEYRELLDYLAEANEGDFLEIVFSTDGGSVDTTIAIINAIQMSEAHVHGTLLSSAMSGGSAIFLACASQTVCVNARFMVHEQRSSGIGGKASDLAAYVDFETKAHRSLMTSIYKDFLTDKELEQFFAGKEYWMLGDEVASRLALVDSEPSPSILPC